MGCLDFRVMRFEDALYVTEAAKSSTLKVKDKIIIIDDDTIETCAWTPMHLEKDVDLEYVLEQIKKY